MDLGRHQLQAGYHHMPVCPDSCLPGLERRESSASGWNSFTHISTWTGEAQFALAPRGTTTILCKFAAYACIPGGGTVQTPTV